MNDGAALQGFQLHERRDGERRARQHRQCRPGRGVDGGQKRRGRRRRTVSAQCGRREPAALFFAAALAGARQRGAFSAGRARQYGVRRFRGMGRAAGPVHRKAGARLLLADDRETHLAQDPGEIQHHVHGLVDPAAGRRTDRAGLPDICHDGDAGGLHVFRRGQYAVFGLGASDVRSGGRLRCRDGTQHGAVVGVEHEQRDGAHAFRAVRGPAGRQQRVLFLQQQLRQRGAALEGGQCREIPARGDLRLQDEPACVQRGPHQRHRTQCHRAGEHRLLPDRDRQRGRENHKLYA